MTENDNRNDWPVTIDTATREGIATVLEPTTGKRNGNIVRKYVGKFSLPAEDLTTASDLTITFDRLSDDDGPTATIVRCKGTSTSTGTLRFDGPYHGTVKAVATLDENENVNGWNVDVELLAGTVGKRGAKSTRQML